MRDVHTKGRANPRTLANRKCKRTFSLSVEALAYLDALSEDCKSTSEALERLIRKQKNLAEKARVSSAIRSYYDSITDRERAENLAWGELSGSQFLKE